MYIVREQFTAKPGMASKLAALFKQIAGMLPGDRARMRVMTDAIGPLNTVVLETEVAALGDFEAMMKEYGARDDIKLAMKGYTEMYLSGRREVYRLA